MGYAGKHTNKHTQRALSRGKSCRFYSASTTNPRAFAEQTQARARSKLPDDVFFTIIPFTNFE
uniref:Uncharacterized protein n=1 Tax=Anopheles quadriannulatus TaxID=34691 RepID=A0A182XR20_ANOQN